MDLQKAQQVIATVQIAVKRQPMLLTEMPQVWYGHGPRIEVVLIAKNSYSKCMNH